MVDDSGNVLPTDKEVVFCFSGGPRDGDRSSLGAPSPSGFLNEVSGYWQISDKGTIGKQVPVWTRHSFDAPGAFSGGPPIHCYEVVGREETATEVVVTLEYRGNNPPKN
jgi:hypothetical protein